MKRLILVFLIFIVHSELYSFDKNDYLFRIPILPFAIGGVVISEDESRVIVCEFYGFSLYDLTNDTLITRIKYFDEGTGDAFENTPIFITNDKLLLAESGSYYIYNVLTKEKNIFINETGNQGPFSIPSITPDKKIFGFTNFDGTIFLVDVDNKEIKDSLKFDFNLNP